MGERYGEMTYAEFYTRRALNDYAPCEDCSPEYQAAFSRIQTFVEAADTLFDMAYREYADLIRLARIEHVE